MTLRHIIIELIKTTHKEKMLEVARGKEETHYIQRNKEDDSKFFVRNNSS